MYLFDFVNVAIEVAIVLFYCSTLFEFKYPLTVPKALLVLVSGIAVAVAGTWRLPSYVNLFISYMMCLVLMNYLYDGKFRNKIFMSMIYIVIAMAGEILAAVIISLFGISYNMAGSDNITYIVGAMLSNFMRLWVCAYIGKILSRRIHGLPVSYWVFIILCPLLSVMCLVIFDIYLMQANDVNRLMVFIPSFCILYINFMLFRFFETYSSNIKLKVVEKLAEQSEENYKVLKNNEDELRILRHDMKNHIMVLHEYIKNNDTEAAEKHLDGIEKTMKKISSVVYTTNPAIDAVLNIGGRKAYAEGVRYDVQLNLNEEVYIDSADICKLLNNAIDNAIEAATQCDDGYIYAELSVSGEEMKIHIENSAKNKNRQSMFATSKADKKNHGFGMRSMKNVVKKYNGYMNYEIKENVFFLDATLKNMVVK